jgi:GntR family transcriptional regulator
MRDVGDQLRQRVLDREFPPGCALPTEAELMNEFQAPRSVVRGALDLLRTERLVERLRGAGTFSVCQKVPHRFERLRAVSAGQDQGEDRTAGSVVALDVVAATPFLARNLAVPEASPCLRVEVLVTFDAVPYSLTTNFLPGDLATQARQTPYSGDWWRFLTDLGCSPSWADVAVEATPADAYAAPLLAVEVGDPILLVTRIVYDAGRHPLNYAFSRNRSDRLQLTMRIPIGDADINGEHG